MEIFISKYGQRYGPYTLEQVKQYLREGNLTTQDLACYDEQNWVPLAQFPGFSETSSAQPVRRQPPKATKPSIPATRPANPSHTPPAQPVRRQGAKSINPGIPATRPANPSHTPPAQPVRRQGAKTTNPGIPAKPRSSRGAGSRSPVGAPQPGAADSKWMILTYTGAGLTFLFIFLPWYSASITGRGINKSEWVNGFHDGVDNWGILTLVATIAAVVMTFFMETKKFSGISMGVAALGAFLPVATTDSNSMKIMGTTVSAGTSWGLWLCFFSAVATSVFMFLMANENPVRQPVPRPRSKAPRRRPPRRR